MPIIVEMAESYRTCACCASDKNVVKITVLRRVGNSEQGTEIVLCENCAKDLRRRLGEGKNDTSDDD